MNTLLCSEPGEFSYVDREIPRLEAGFTLLKIKQVGICGTDYHAYQGTQPYFNYPRVLGHEIAAVIEETDNTEFRKGELVTISPYNYCGLCIACRHGKTNCCTDMKVFGVHVDGAMSEFFLVPDRAIIQGGALSADELVLAEPLAIGAHGVARANISKGEFVLVMGAGPIGLGTMNFAAIAGATVIAMDVNEQRLDFCKAQLGVHHTINPVTENVMERLREITGNDMPTVVIDCTGNLKAMNAAVDYMAHGGRLVLIGLQKESISISHPDFHKREGTLMSSRNALPEDFRFVIECIRNGLVQTQQYITHRVDFQDVKDEFSRLSSPESKVIKAVISFNSKGSLI